MTHTARREFSIFFFNLSHRLPTRGGAQLASATIMVKFPASQLVNDNQEKGRVQETHTQKKKRNKNTKNKEKKNHRTDGV